MPNHVTNLVQFVCSKEQYAEIAESIRKDGSFFGSVDFNKLIPMPQSLDIECGSVGDRGLKEYRQYLREMDKLSQTWGLKSKIPTLKEYAEQIGSDYRTISLGKQYFENLLNYGVTTWYEWSVEHWGSKWNAYDCVEMNPDSLSLQFSTAWSCVAPVMKALSNRFPNITISYSWADEDIGRNVGSMILLHGNIIDVNLPVEDSKEAYELAADVWGSDIKEMGFIYDKNGDTYRYVGFPNERTDSPPVQDMER